MCAFVREHPLNCGTSADVVHGDQRTRALLLEETHRQELRQHLLIRDDIYGKDMTRGQRLSESYEIWTNTRGLDVNKNRSNVTHSIALVFWHSRMKIPRYTPPHLVQALVQIVLFRSTGY